jgi:hypothetical protein
VAENILTDGGPSDPNRRRLKEATGWKPYSIRIGDSYIPYRKYLGPLGPLVAGVSDMYGVAHEADTDGFAAASAAAIFGFSEVVADETWFSGLSNFVEAARQYDNPVIAEKYLRGLATDFLPFSVGMSQVARLVDPYARQVNSFTDAFKNKIPFVSESLLPMRDVWGNPIKSSTILSKSTAVHDPVNDALMALDFKLAPPQRSITGVRLTPQQYDDYSRIAGRMAHIQLDALVRTPGFQSLIQTQPGVATKTIQGIVKGARERARSMVKMQSVGSENDIVKQATANKMAIFQSKSGTAVQ